MNVKNVMILSKMAKSIGQKMEGAFVFRVIMMNMMDLFSLGILTEVNSQVTI